MGKQFSVRILGECMICGNPLPKRYRSYCSEKCRNYRNYLKAYAYRKKYAQDKRGEYAEGKKKCKICGKWYVQVGSHIVQVHHETAREYREEFNLPVKRGIVPKWFREFKAKQTLENKTYLNLKKGKPKRFVKGDERAKTAKFWKSHRYIPDEYYE